MQGNVFSRFPHPYARGMAMSTTPQTLDVSQLTDRPQRHSWVAFGVIWGLWTVVMVLSIAWAIENGAFSHSADKINVSHLQEAVHGQHNVKHVAPPRDRVLVVHSYHPGYEWTAGIMRGLRHELVMREVDLQVVYMDTKRRPSEAWKQQCSREILDDIAAWKPAVVVLVDDNAQQYVGKVLAPTGETSIVFCGVNGDAWDYGYGRGVTGVLERPHARASVEYLRLQFPDVRRIGVLADLSTTSHAILKHLPKQLADLDLAFIETPETFTEWQAVVRRAGQQADALYVPIYHVVKDDQGEVIKASEVMKWTAEHCDVPVIGAFTFAVDDGAFCGVVESAIEQGELAGRAVRTILAGTRAHNIPIVTAYSGTRMLNLDALRRLGIEPTEAILERTERLVGGALP